MQLNEDKFQVIQHGKLAQILRLSPSLHYEHTPTFLLLSHWPWCYYWRRPRLGQSHPRQSKQSLSVLWLDTPHLQVARQRATHDSFQQPGTQQAGVLTVWDILVYTHSKYAGRRERYIILQVWKIWKSIDPNDVKLEFHFNARLGPQFKKTTEATHLDTLKFNSFCSSGPGLFNTIPGDIKPDKKRCC